MEYHDERFLKYYRGLFAKQTIPYEQIIQQQLLDKLAYVCTTTLDGKIDALIQRHFPVCLFKRGFAKSRKLIRDDLSAQNLHNSFEESGLYDVSGYSEACRLVNLGLSGLPNFEKMMTQESIECEALLAYFEDVMAKNAKLQNQLSELVFKQHPITITPMETPPPQFEVLKTERVVEAEFSSSLRLKQKIEIRRVDKSARQLINSQKIHSTIRERVVDRTPTTQRGIVTEDTCRFERRLLLEEAKRIDETQVAEIRTLQHTLLKLKEKQRQLKEDRIELSSKIDTARRTERAIHAATARGLETEKIKRYKEIYEKNKAQLHRVSSENGRLRRQIAVEDNSIRRSRLSQA